MVTDLQVDNPSPLHANPQLKVTARLAGANKLTKSKNAVADIYKVTPTQLELAETESDELLLSESPDIDIRGEVIIYSTVQCVHSYIASDHFSDTASSLNH